MLAGKSRLGVDTYPIVIPDAIGPQSQHSPKGDEDAEGIGEQKHGLRLKFEVLLYIPKSEGWGDRAGSLGNAKICELQERKWNSIVLDDADESAYWLMLVSSLVHIYGRIEFHLQ